jgi:predicted PurR-regulated permease PerM
VAIDEITLPAAATTSRGPVKEERSWHWSHNLLGIGMILAFCYFAETVLAALLVSVLLAFVLAPIVDALAYLRIPRSIASAFAVLLLITAGAGVVYSSYNQAANLEQDIPKYANRIRDEVMRFRKRAETFEVLTPEHEKGVLSVRPATDWGDLVSRYFGSVSEAIGIIGFIPFLVYFMLTWQQHVRSATVMLFPMETRQTAYITLGLISAMIRSFMVGNLMMGLFIGGISTVVFWILGIPFFYFVGFISGFLSLIPYLGIVLALVPPFFVGLGHLGPDEAFYVVVTVVGLHLIVLNILYPKFLGNRLQLNPLAVTISALVWGWLWGAVGLLLCVPIAAAMKIIFDHIENLKPYGAWLGE